MKLQFDPNLAYQAQAVSAVVDLFRGQTPKQTNFTVSAYTGQVGMEDTDHGIGTATDQQPLQHLGGLDDGGGQGSRAVIGRRAGHARVTEPEIVDLMGTEHRRGLGGLHPAVIGGVEGDPVGHGPLLPCRPQDQDHPPAGVGSAAHGTTGEDGLVIGMGLNEDRSWHRGGDAARRRRQRRMDLRTWRATAVFFW